MSNNPKTNQTSGTRKSSSLPKNLNREFIAVKESAALALLDCWVDSELEELLDRNSEFESPSSRKKYFSR